MLAITSRGTTSSRYSRRRTATCRAPRKCLASSDRISTRSCGLSGLLPGAGPELVLEHLRCREAFDLQVVLHALPQRRRRHQPDDLTLEYLYAVALGLALDEIEHAEDWRLLVIGEIHRHLDDAAILERNAHRLDVAQPAAAHAYRGGDFLGDVEPIGGEIDVVGDERHARADHRRPGALMRGGRAKVRRPSRLLHLRGETFELPAADVFEVFPRRVRRSVLIQIDGQ